MAEHKLIDLDLLTHYDGKIKELIDSETGNTTYTLSAGTGADAEKIVLTDSDGNEDKVTVPYATNAGTVNGKTVAENVPANAVFTDTTYSAASNSGISLNGTAFSNSGVRSVTSGSSAQGTINVNTNGTAADVGIKGVYFGRVGSISDLVDINTISGGDISVTLDQAHASFSYGDRMVVFFYTTYEKDSELSNDVRFKINGGSTWIPVYTNDLARLTLTNTIKLNSGYAYTFTYCEYDEAGCFVVEDLHNYYSASNLLASNVSGGLSGSTVQAQLNNAGTTKQNKTDNSLTTTAKTVVGAINEVNDNLISETVAVNAPANAGKNLLINNNILQATTKKGVTLTPLYDADGYWCGFSFDDTLTSANYGFEFANFILKSGTYTLNMDLSTTNKRTALLIYNSNMDTIDYVNNTDRLTATFTINDDTNVRVFIYAYSEAGDYDGFIARPMLRNAMVIDDTYAPYIPSVETRLEDVEESTIANRAAIDNDGSGINLLDIGDSLSDWGASNSNGTTIIDFDITTRVTGSVNKSAGTITITNYNTGGYVWMAKFLDLKKNTEYKSLINFASSFKIMGCNSKAPGTVGTKITTNGENTFNSGNYDYWFLTIYPDHFDTISNLMIKQIYVPNNTYVPYVPSVNSRLDTVENVTKLKTVNVLPVSGHGITIDDGGVYRVGDLVIVQIKFTTTDATTDFFYNLPHPKQTGSTTLINLLSGDGTLFNVNASGFLRSVSRQAGTYSCTGVYVTDAS